MTHVVLVTNSTPKNTCISHPLCIRQVHVVNQSPWMILSAFLIVQLAYCLRPWSENQYSSPQQAISRIESALQLTRVTSSRKPSIELTALDEECEHFTDVFYMYICQGRTYIVDIWEQRRLCGPAREEVTGGWKSNEELHNFCSSPNRMRWVDSFAHVGRWERHQKF